MYLLEVGRVCHTFSPSLRLAEDKPAASMICWYLLFMNGLPAVLTPSHEEANAQLVGADRVGLLRLEGLVGADGVGLLTLEGQLEGSRGLLAPIV